MNTPFYGATRAEWEAFSSLLLADLLPTVCDPKIRRHHTSNNTSPLNKIPSAIDAAGLGYAMLRWPDRVTTSIEDWAADPRLGICIITRTLHAFDIDIADEAQAARAEAIIREHFGIDGLRLPMRTRPGSGSRAMLYRMRNAPDRVSKQVVRMSSKKCDMVGAVEFLFHRQQLHIAGAHKSGTRVEWKEGIPTNLEDVPELEYADVIDLIRYLKTTFGVDTPDPSPGGSTPGRRHKGQVDPNDAHVAFLKEYDWVRAEGHDGVLHVDCPWRGDHEHPTPENTTEAAFFPTGLGGLSHPGFKCMHATCQGRTWQSFLVAIGFEDEAFPIVEADAAYTAAQTRPQLTYKGKTNAIEATLPNVANLLRWKEGLGYTLRYDSFKEAIVYHNAADTTWRLFDDDLYTKLRLRLVDMGMEKHVTKEYVISSVSLVAREQAMDSAQEWLAEVEWDGVSRIANFHTNVLKLEDTPYYQAVCFYLWTALAGRIVEPGCKADMVPILIGKQGLRKSTFVEAIAPSEAEYTAVSLAARDSDLARQLRGKVVAEWDEMRGLNTRESEAIKGWVTHRTDEWVPKFKEFAITAPRRFILVGTTNDARVFNDHTGARRWLPVWVERPIDTTYVRENREQLWAEGRALFQAHGVMWQKAEALAGAYHRRATVRDVWVDPVRQWLREQGNRDGWTSTQILSGACSVAVAHANAGTYLRLQRVMAYIGWEERDGKWFCEIA